MGLFWISLAALLVTSLPASEALPGPAATPSKQPVPKVSFHYQDKPAGSAAGKSVPLLVVQVELQPGWHAKRLQQQSKQRDAVGEQQR